MSIDKSFKVSSWASSTKTKLDGNKGNVLEKEKEVRYEKTGTLNKHGITVVSKDHVSIVMKENKNQETASLIAKPILDSIFFRMEKLVNYNGEKRTCLKKTPSHIRKPLMILPDRPSMKKTGSYTSHEFKEKKSENPKQTQGLSSVVKELELPVNLSKSKTNLESRPKFERIALDTHVTTSSTIITSQEERSVKVSCKSGSQSDDMSISDTEEASTIGSPFELYWCFGFNSEVPIINLSNDDSFYLLFANSQYAVIYDFHEDTMNFLQGHLETVSCLAANPTGDILVTADAGSDFGTSRVIVWDRQPCVIQILNNVHPHGCQQVGIGPKGEFLVTVSAKEIPTTIKIWEYERDTINPSASTTVRESSGNIKKITIHPTSKSEFIATFERSAIFAHLVWQTIFHENAKEGRIGEIIKDCEFCVSTLIPQKLGSLTDTTFLESTEAIALSSTCKGYVIVWEDNINSKHKKTYRKYVRLHLDAITNIQIVDDKISVATESGNVSFYDSDLKILFFHKPLQEPLVSLSFNLTTHRNENTHNTCLIGHPSCASTWKREHTELFDASLNNEPFSVRHFVVSTESGRIAYVNASCGTPKYLSFPSKDMFTALDMLPNSKFLCAGTASGKCILFDTDRCKIKVTKQIKVQADLCQAISRLKYSPSGHTLACGMYSGNIWLLDPLLLDPIFESPLTDCDCCISILVFSTYSEYLVVTDVSFCISVYFLEEKPTLIGQYIAHNKSIVQVHVEPNDPGDTVIYIFTLSTDRSVCLFAINRGKRSLEFIYNQLVEQTSIPMYSMHYRYYSSSISLFLGVNRDGKWRVHENPLSTVLMAMSRRCRGTFQAPDFGSPINYFEVFENNEQQYLFFKTKNHIGIQLFPIDSNPFKALGYRASPTDITDTAITPDGKYLFTISESVGGISMWEINVGAVEDFYKSGGEGLEPFLKMITEEKEQEIRDFFDLGQFLHQGEGPSLVRTLKNSLPICEVANVLQALGCLLTKQEINELTNEVMNANADNSPTYNIEYEDFVRLYFNYRKTNGLNIKELRQAFRDFHTGVYYGTDEVKGRLTDTDPVFDSASFIQKLMETGEEMTFEELYADFSILTGGHPEPIEGENFTSQVPPTMPKEISFEVFVKDILGFSVDDSVLKEN